MPDWTRAQIRQRVTDHGNHHLTSIAGFIDGAVQESVEELVRERDWDWREQELLVTPGTEILDLGPVRQVFRTTAGEPLTPTTRADLRDRYGGDLSLVGEPIEYYVDRGTKMIHTYPTDGEQITVVHLSIACWVETGGSRVFETSEEAAKPTVPAEMRDMIVLLARARCKSEAQDHDEVTEIRAQYEDRLEEEVSQRPQVDEHKRIRITNGDWS
jgi:hypothetical protein